jgi:hypothetical protein
MIVRGITTVLTGALLWCVGGSVGSAQASAQDWGLAGTTYTLHSSAASGCPAMDWFLVVMNDGTLSGIVGVDDMRTLFRISGTHSGANFRLDGTEVGGTRTGVVNGQIQASRIALMFGGLPVGSACQGKTTYIKRRNPAPAGGAGG